jgi:calcium-dependent protein kinase
MYALLSGTSPFYWANEDEMACVVACQNVRFPGKRFAAVSERGMDLLRRMLEREPTRRIRAEAALRHAWFADLECRSE